MTKKDKLLAVEMASDIAHSIDFFGAGGNYSTAALLHDYVNSIAVAGEYPSEDNYNDNGCTPGVWTWFDPACRYNMDYPAFDKALEAKIPGFSFTNPEDVDLEDLADPECFDPDAPILLEECEEVFQALDAIYAEAIKIVHKWVDNEPEKHFANAMEDAFAKEI